METYTDFLKRLAKDTGGLTGEDIERAATIIDELLETLEKASELFEVETEGLIHMNEWTRTKYKTAGGEPIYSLDLDRSQLVAARTLIKTPLIKYKAEREFP